MSIRTCTYREVLGNYTTCMTYNRGLCSVLKSLVRPQEENLGIIALSSVQSFGEHPTHNPKIIKMKLATKIMEPGKDVLFW